MRYSLYLHLFLLIIYTGCSGDFRPSAKGDLDTIIVITDTTQEGSQLFYEALMETFGRPIPTVPSYEPLYRIVIENPSTEQELSRFKERTNVIIAAPIDENSNPGSLLRSMLNDELESQVRANESFAFPIQELWAKEQWLLLLTSTSYPELADNLLNSGELLTRRLLDSELSRRVNEIYDKGEQTDLSDSLMQKFGWSVRMQHDYIQTMDTTHFVQFRRILADNERWMWAWWQDEVKKTDHITPDWINSTRDSLMQQYIRGKREGSFIQTEYRRPVLTTQLDHDYFSVFETQGTWRMENDFMGGPFVNFVYHDPQDNRLYMIEYGQFAPNVGKRRFVRQFQTMGRTFTTQYSSK